MPPKKILKVAVNETSLNIDNPNNESLKSVASIEAPKVEIPDIIEQPSEKKKRVMSSDRLANLERGRERLKVINQEKKATKELLAKIALEKKVAKALKQKRDIEKSFGLTSDDEEETDDEFSLSIPKKNIPTKKESLKKEVPKKEVPKKEVPMNGEGRSTLMKKEYIQVATPAPKKEKRTKYIEVEESSSEEEEIVYVKKAKNREISNREISNREVKNVAPLIPSRNIIFY